MSEISAAAVRELREMTGAGMMDCKNALVETSGDVEAAKDALRKKGLQKADKKASRTASEGRIGVYMHFTGKTAAMVELNCETDFVARNEKFLELANELAIHVMALNPRYISREQVPDEDRKREEAVILGSEDMKNKPESAREKMLEGRMRKFYESQCLVDQAFVKAEDGKTVGQMLKDAVTSLGENIQVGRFSRIEVGG